MAAEAVFKRLTFELPECGDCCTWLSDRIQYADGSDHGSSVGIWAPRPLGCLPSGRRDLHQAFPGASSLLPPTSTPPAHADLARGRLFDRERYGYDLFAGR